MGEEGKSSLAPGEGLTPGYSLNPAGREFPDGTRFRWDEVGPSLDEGSITRYKFG